jgi:hypothetical protein
MITSHINRDTGIIETIFEGKITFEDIVDYITQLRNIEKFPKRLLILSDCVHGRFSFTSEEDQLIAGIVKQYAPAFEQIKDAIIVDDPRTTAYSVLYRNASAYIPNYQFEIFSTRQAAIDWLLS